MSSLELAIATAIARDSLPERACRVCGELKGPGAFPRDARKRDGLDTRCKACDAARVARYHAARKNDPEYREMRRERAARWRAENADKVRESNARYARENPEVFRAIARVYRPPAAV